jgi:hypothetical protein
MARPLTWRVRVRRATETWIDVEAMTAAEAEEAARGVPGVLSVFHRSAVLPREVGEERPPGVRED